MKKYVRPTTELFRCELDALLRDSVIKGGREAQWGAGDGTNPYANDDWNTEGYGGGNEGIDDDYGEIDAQGKAWGDLWDDIIW